MITINGALAIDIHGQVVADTIAGDPVLRHRRPRGLRRRPGALARGRSLLCLPSTVDGRRRAASRGSSPGSTPATVITTPRHQVDVIVTEYGAAELQGKTIHQRGEALAAIAHPDFRDELLEAAERASGGRSTLEELR